MSAGTKEIRAKIKSIKSTAKITKAMQMVATSKMKKAEERMSYSRPYAERIKVVIANLAQGKLDYQHPFLVARPVKNVGFIVIGSDRGLCGGLNINLFKEVAAKIAAYKQQDTKIKVCCVGKKSESFFRRYGGNIIATVNNIGDKPVVKDLIGVVKVMLDEYRTEQLDRIYIVYNHFLNTMTQTACVEQMLPIIDTTKTKDGRCWDYIYEPSAEKLINKLLLRYVETLVYQGVVENMASEQSARMVAMKNATDNAGELIDDFQLVYNKARQSAITRELSEIVAGAAAV
jgi:F-type H+-transporting ATPase subunit gamma